MLVPNKLKAYTFLRKGKTVVVSFDFLVNNCMNLVILNIKYTNIKNKLFKIFDLLKELISSPQHLFIEAFFSGLELLPW